MLNAPNLTPKDIELVRREIQEIRDAKEAFRAAVEAGETAGFQNGGLRAHDGHLIVPSGRIPARNRNPEDWGRYLESVTPGRMIKRRSY